MSTVASKVIYSTPIILNVDRVFKRTHSTLEENLANRFQFARQLSPVQLRQHALDILDLNSLHFRFPMYAKKGVELC